MTKNTTDPAEQPAVTWEEAIQSEAMYRHRDLRWNELCELFAESAWPALTAARDEGYIDGSRYGDGDRYPAARVAWALTACPGLARACGAVPESLAAVVRLRAERDALVQRHAAEMQEMVARVRQAESYRFRVADVQRMDRLAAEQAARVQREQEACRRIDQERMAPGEAAFQAAMRGE